MTGYEKSVKISSKNIEGGVCLFPQAGRKRDLQPAGGTHAGPPDRRRDARGTSCPQAGRKRDLQPAGGTQAGPPYYFEYVELKL